MFPHLLPSASELIFYGSDVSLRAAASRLIFLPFLLPAVTCDFLFPVLHQHSPVDFHFSYSDFHLFPSCQTAVFPALPVSGYDIGSGALLSSPVPPSLIHGNIHCSCRPDGNCYAPYPHLPGFCPPLLSEDFCFPVSSVFSRKHHSQTQKTVLHPTF